MTVKEVFLKARHPEELAFFREQLYKKFADIFEKKSGKWESGPACLFFKNISNKDFNHSLVKWYRKRIDRDFKVLKEWIIGKRVLDYGCGKGDIGLKIYQKLGKEVILADIEDRNETNLIFYQIGEAATPFKDGFFDSVFLINVLHHTREPAKVLREANRVARKRIIIFEHNLFDSRTSHGLPRRMCFALFRIIEELFFCPGKRKEPLLNFQTRADLIRIFRDNNLRIVREECIPFFNRNIFILNGWLFVLDKE